ncbi:MAG TPA: D-alanyl carrier protein [Bacteroidetes bacterium]|nr:D-alanyl carrier protein [Bacteroidota bacterium]
MNMEHIEHDDDIFQLGYVNSLFAIQIVSFLEEKFKIKFENEDLTVSNFNTIINICNFLNKKLDIIPDPA